MEQKNRIIAVTPLEYEQLRRRCPGADPGLAQLAYRISSGGRLLRDSRSPAGLRGGLLVLGDRGFQETRLHSPTLIQDLLSEVENRRYEGIVADFSQHSEALSSFLTALDRVLDEKGIPLWVNESAAAQAPHARLLIHASATGGSLETLLREACVRYGASRVTAELIPLRMDYTLPAAGAQSLSPTPARLTREALDSLMESLHPQPYFSSELCAKYFTYMSHERQAHFVLFDDGDTLRAKCALASRLGISHVFALYAETQSMLDDLLRPEEQDA